MSRTTTRTKWVEVEVDLDDLSDVDDDALMQEAERRGLSFREGESGLPNDLEERLRLLVLIGQQEHALRELLIYLEPHVGKLAVPCATALQGVIA